MGSKIRILVIGGTGMLGSPVVRGLFNNGFDVRVLSRNFARARRMFTNEEIEIAEGDIDDPSSVDAALTNCYGVHINLMGGPTQESFERIEHEGSAFIAHLAAKKSIRHLTYLSGAPVDPANFHDHGTKAKFFAEEAIKSSGVPFTIFRATWMMESLNLFIRGNNAVILGKQPHKIRWIAADDYGAIVAKAYKLPQALNRTFYLFGPESLSKPEAMQIYIDIVDPRLKLRSLPLRLMKFLASVSFNKILQADVRRMEYYDKIGDAYGNGVEADQLFGASTTTLAKWCHDYKSSSTEAPVNLRKH